MYDLLNYEMLSILNEIISSSKDLNNNIYSLIYKILIEVYNYYSDNILTRFAQFDYLAISSISKISVSILRLIEIGTPPEIFKIIFDTRSNKL